MTHEKCLKSHNLIKSDPLWACGSIGGYGRKVHAKIWPWGNPCNLIYDHFWDLCQSLVGRKGEKKEQGRKYEARRRASGGERTVEEEARIVEGKGRPEGSEERKLGSH